MFIPHFFEKNRWMLEVALGFLAIVLPFGAFAEEPKGTVWVADENGNSVTVIDASTNKVVKTITGIMGPHNVQVSPDGKNVWATSGHENEVVVIDTKSYKVRGRIRWVRKLLTSYSPLTANWPTLPTKKATP